MSRFSAPAAAKLVNVAESEGIPRRLRRKFQIADVGAKAQSDTGPDRHNDDVAGGERRHAETTYEIRGAVDAGETLIDRSGRRQVIDEHHRARAFAAIVEADRRAFPEHAAVARILCVKLAVAVAQANDNGAAAFLTENVTIGLAPAAEGRFHDLGKTARYRSEKLVAFANDLPGRERAALPLRRGWLVLRSRKVGSEGGKAKRQCGEAQVCAHQMLLGCWGPTALFNRMLMLTAVIMWRRKVVPESPNRHREL